MGLPRLEEILLEVTTGSESNIIQKCTHKYDSKNERTVMTQIHNMDNRIVANPNTMPTQQEQPEKQMPNMHESGALKHKPTRPRPAANMKRPQKATKSEESKPE